MPLYKHIADLAGNTKLILPVPSFNIINGARDQRRGRCRLAQPAARHMSSWRPARAPPTHTQPPRRAIPHSPPPSLPSRPLPVVYPPPPPPPLAPDLPARPLALPCHALPAGGVHAGNALAFQEFMIMPTGASTFAEAMRVRAQQRCARPSPWGLFLLSLLWPSSPLSSLLPRAPCLPASSPPSAIGPRCGLRCGLRCGVLLRRTALAGEPHGPAVRQPAPPAHPLLASPCPPLPGVHRHAPPPLPPTPGPPHLQLGSEVYHHLKGIIKKKYGVDAVNVGDEGGFAPGIQVGAWGAQQGGGCLLCLWGGGVRTWWRQMRMRAAVGTCSWRLRGRCPEGGRHSTEGSGCSPTLPTLLPLPILASRLPA